MARSRLICIVVLIAAIAPKALAQTDAPLPPGVSAVWDTRKAWTQSTPTRQRICINGLWRWQPAETDAREVPSENWGYFKVPGAWPGITDYLQKDSQIVFAHPSWKERRLSEISAAWYQREIEIPRAWAGQQIKLSADYVNSLAAVFIDGKPVGKIFFPAGEIDLSSVCRPGEKHVLSLLVSALPLKDVMLAYRDTATGKQVKGSVPRRGLCGDVYLVATSKASTLIDVKLETSVRQGQVAITAMPKNLAESARYILRARISDGGKEITQFTSKPFGSSDLKDGRIFTSANWKPDRLWDINTPQNQYDVQVSLEDASGKVLDTFWPVRFGYREFWIDGRDFYLNGTRIFLSAVPIDSAQIGVASDTYAAVKETLLRLKRIGINFVYTHNYDCQPGSHLSFEELLRAADDVGILVSFSQPHFSQYDWQQSDSDKNNGYAAHAAFYVRVAENHPSVVMYSMSHNATGYNDDMNPDMIDGIHDPRDQWADRNSKMALRAQAIVNHLDPGRIVYHHAGGNIGAMHTVNFYPNFAPIQELSDWFGHWATVGVKPLFLCEYGAPFTWDWTMYRGWYQGKREFGSAAVPWEFCLAEWDAQFLGDRAFAISDAEKANLRWENKQFAAGRVWHRWDYPTQVGSAKFEDRNQIMGDYIADNWRAYRTWGVSGISPWEYEMFWTLKPGVDHSRKQLPVDWDNLQRPGLSPDYIDQRFEQIDTAYEYDDWVPTAAGKAVLRNNQPVLAYIAGKATAFTSKDHYFLPGQTVEKQLILINNSRQTQTFECDWSFQLPQPISGHQRAVVETGQQARIPLKFELPATLAPGAYELRATVRFGDGQEQKDTFTIQVLPASKPAQAMSKLALFDPKGDTAALLKQLGLSFATVDANARLSSDQTLIVGKLALSLDGPAPDISAVRDGLKVIVFEQSANVLQKRLGFRVNEYGLRRVFPRVDDHPLLAGIDPQNLRDWAGEATTLPRRLSYETRPRYGPTVEWNGIPVPHIWRCGNRGNVASALIEKPAAGDFLPILDGGFSLQYSPLLQYRQGKGMILFCQMDVTRRTEADPAAEALTRNILQYTATWKPQPVRRALYIGNAEGQAHLRAIGVDAAIYNGGELSPADKVLIVTSGADQVLSANRQPIADFLKSGGRLLAIALSQQELNALLPLHVTVKNAEHINAVFSTHDASSPFAGVGPADLHNRGPREIPLIASGATVVGDGVLAVASADSKTQNVVFCQLAPWQFDYRHSYNLKRTYRRSAFLLTRLLANLGIAGDTRLVEFFDTPWGAKDQDKRWLDGLYLDTPEEWDDPYRFFRW